MGNKKAEYLINQAKDVVFDAIEAEIANRSANGCAYNADDLSMFVAHQLTYNRAKALKKPQSPLSAFKVFEVSTEVPEGADTAMQKVYTEVGMAKIVANPADDLPTSDEYVEEIPTKVYTVATSYRYSVQDIINAAFGNENLTERKAMSAYNSIDRKINKIAWFGDTDANITGFIDNPYVSTYNVLADGTGSSIKFTDKTPAQIYRDVNAIIDSVETATKGNIYANKVIADPAIINLLSETIFVDANGNAKTQTILELLKSNHPEVDFVKVPELGSTGALIAGNFDEEFVHLEIPKRASQEPIQRKNLSFVVPVWGRVIGVTINYPLAFSKATALV